MSYNKNVYFQLKADISYIHYFNFLFANFLKCIAKFSYFKKAFLAKNLKLAIFKND